jgi:hypothetical protein
MGILIYPWEVPGWDWPPLPVPELQATEEPRGGSDRRPDDPPADLANTPRYNARPGDARFASGVSSRA